MTSKLDWQALWEVPLGGLSFLYSRLIKWSLTFISRYYSPARKQIEPQWQVVSADFLQGPVKLLWTMSRARWNLHALIAIAGPFTVTRSLAVEIPALRQSAKAWTAVIYTLQNYKTITSISSLTVPAEADWVTVELPPGRYLVGLRHYQWHDPIQLPSIQVDQQLALGAQLLAAPPDFNQFYRDLSHRRGWLYSSLNFYVYPLLRYQQWLPARFVKQTFLPVPNPETQFYYGALETGEALQLKATPELLATHSLFLSLYSRDCFPLDWYAVTTTEHTTQPLPEKGVYILRIHPQRPGLSVPDQASIHLDII